MSLFNLRVDVPHFSTWDRIVHVCSLVLTCSVANFDCMFNVVGLSCGQAQVALKNIKGSASHGCSAFNIQCPTTGAASH